MEHQVVRMDLHGMRLEWPWQALLKVTLVKLAGFQEVTAPDYRCVAFCVVK